MKKQLREEHDQEKRIHPGAGALSGGSWNNGVGAPLCRESLLTKVLRITLFQKERVHFPFLRSWQGGFGRSPVMGQGTGPLQVLRAAP